MENNALNTFANRWDQPESDSRLELVFQDRLRDYGAYVVRKKYRRNQVIAIVASAAFAILVTSLPAILAFVNKKEPSKKITFTATTVDDIQEDKKDEEKPKEPPKMKEPEVASQQYVTPKVNPNAAQDDVIIPPDEINNTGTTTKKGSTEDPPPFLDDGTGGGPTGGDNDGPPQYAAQKAMFPGGEEAFREFIKENFVYPVRCQDEGINGSVILKFVVDVSGRIVTRPIVVEETASCPEFTEEAIRVLLKSPRWIPGQNNGKFIKSWREIPIRLTVD